MEADHLIKRWEEEHSLLSSFQLQERGGGFLISQPWGFYPLSLDPLLILAQRWRTSIPHRSTCTSIPQGLTEILSCAWPHATAATDDGAPNWLSNLGWPIEGCRSHAVPAPSLDLKRLCSFCSLSPSSASTSRTGLVKPAGG